MGVLFPLLLGCAHEAGLSRREVVDSFLQEPAVEVDILWVIDDSGTMQNEQDQLAAGFQAFADSLLASGSDFQLGVVTTDMDSDNPDRADLLGEPPILTVDDDFETLLPERMLVGTSGSNKEKGLSAALEAVSEPRISGGNAGFLRAEADLSIIVVSDENDCSDDEALAEETHHACYSKPGQLVAVDDFVADFRLLKDGPRVTLSGLIAPDDHSCEDSWEGKRYAAVADQLGGIVGDICEADYGGLMDEMGFAAAGLISVFQLSEIPDTASLVVHVDEVEVAEDPDEGWRYDGDSNAVRFDGAYVPERGSTVSVAYDVAI